MDRVLIWCAVALLVVGGALRVWDVGSLLDPVLVLPVAVWCVALARYLRPASAYRFLETERRRVRLEPRRLRREGPDATN